MNVILAPSETYSLPPSLLPPSLPPPSLPPPSLPPPSLPLPLFLPLLLFPFPLPSLSLPSPLPFPPPLPLPPLPPSNCRDFCFRDYPEVLPKLLSAVKWNEPAAVAEVRTFS